MHIAIDASRTTVAQVTGTEHYARQMIRHILGQPRAHDYTLYFRDAPPDALFPRAEHATFNVIPFPRAWTHLRLAAETLRERPDILWTPAHALPFVFPGRAAVTVHDLGYRYFPQAHPPAQRRYLDLTTRASAARASVILADSRATADDLMRFYGTPARKIRIVYPGVDAPPVGDADAARRKYGLPERYFLFIGTLQPRKNIARLVAAYQRWRAAQTDDPPALVLAGGKGWLFDPAWVADADGVVLSGYIDAADKGAVLAGALALVFPSLYEGFGFPVLEAMTCGTPVICSSTSSLPELAGDAALLVDPLSEVAIAAAMRQIASDEALRSDLIARGLAQARQFSWEAAAAAALDALESAV
ncbi:MAG: glycosyltransferase family 4 protein [Anaerolineae bacterium]|nr:glycosyltransferase family 4 protein [Anaerolineae bacterium]